MKRRNFIRLSAGIPFIMSPPVLAQHDQNKSEGFSDRTFGSQPLLKVKTGSKVKYNWCRKKVIDIPSLTDYNPTKDSDLSTYGGDKTRNVGGTGYFRTEKINNRWYMIDPDGHPFISAGFNSVKVKDNNEEMIVQSLRDANVSTLGCWSHYEQLRRVKEPLPYSVSLGFIHEFMQSQPKKENHGNGWKRRYPNLTISVFHPEFESFADHYAKERIGKLKDDPYCIGYYSDNELPFIFDALDRYMELPEEDYGHQAASDFLRKRGVTDRNRISYNDRMEFLGNVAEKYFSVCSRYIKKYDPNHLYLGSRIHGYDNSLLRSTTSIPVFKAAGKYADIVSINLYGTIGLSPAELNRFSEWAGKPIHITEFYAKGMDSGLENNEGAGQIVPTQKDRGIFYQNFTLSLLQSKGCTGWDWHRYIDPETSNKGLVNKDYKVYEDFQRKVRELNEQKYSLIDFFHKNHPVKVVREDQNYCLYRNGAPFNIRGHIGVKSPDRLIDIHGNALKIHSDYSYDLDFVTQKDLAVLFTIDLKRFTIAALNKDRQELKAEKDNILDLVKKFKEHPSIMIWCVGDNEVLKLKDGDFSLYWKALNSLVKDVKKEDPDHPVITGLHQASLEDLQDINGMVPDLDAIGFNITNLDMFENLPEKISEQKWEKPFILTDFHYDNDCDIMNAPYDIPTLVEGEGGSLEENAYRKVVLNHPQCLGAFMLT